MLISGFLIGIVARAVRHVELSKGLVRPSATLKIPNMRNNGVSTTKNPIFLGGFRGVVFLIFTKPDASRDFSIG